MKRLLTTFLLTGLIAFQAFAQGSFSLSTDTSFTSDDLSNVLISGMPVPIATKLNVTNNSGVSKTMRWDKTTIAKPSGWYTSVCDANGCYDTTVQSNTFVLAPGASVEMIVDFYAVSVGTGITGLHIYDVNNSSDAVSPVFIASISSANGVAKVVKMKDLQLSPVPAHENLFVEFDKALAPSKMEVYNVLGQLLKTEKMIPNDGSSKIEISLSGLDKGLYFLRVYTGAGKVLTRQFSKD